MITLEEAIAKVTENHLKDWMVEEYEDELIVIKEATIEKPEYWVVFYTSKLFYQSNSGIKSTRYRRSG